MIINLGLSISILAFCITVFFVPLIIKISHKKKWYDSSEDERKIHDGNIPRLGGIGIFTGFLIPMIIVCFSGVAQNYEINKTVIFLIGAALIHAIGLLDDFKNLRPRYKFLGQFIVAGFLLFNGFYFKSIFLINSELGLIAKIFLHIVSFVWIIGVINAVNLIDGIDGLSSTVTMVASLFLAFKSFVNGQYLILFGCAALLGSTLGFFRYNRPKATIFMGDSGSLLLGYALATLPLLQFSKPNFLMFETSLLLLSIPIIDTLFAMSRRIYRGVSIATADKEHIHHILLDFNFSNWAILSILGLFNFILGYITLLPLFFSKNLIQFSLVFSFIFVMIFGIMFLLHKKWKTLDKSLEA